MCCGLDRAGYVRRADVLNRGFSGYNSRWAKEILDRIGTDDLCLATVLLGANDAQDGAQNVPVEEYKENVRSIVSHFSGCGRVLLITPPPVDAEKYLQVFLVPRAEQNGTKKEDIVVDRSTDNVKPYVDACMELGKELGVPVVDIFTPLRDSPDLGSYLSDGLHFSEKGDGFVFDELMKVVEKAFPEIVVTPCKFSGNFSNSGSKCKLLDPLGPWWDKIDPTKTEGFLVEAPNKRQKL
mmetsp:Transcript_15966/g.26087  ORF Transcript_15966/g.26087 Transcript_15966/m.26087 type:complete len:238 (+) Transcript_15966:2452-3165(+)